MSSASAAHYAMHALTIILWKDTAPAQPIQLTQATHFNLHKSQATFTRFENACIANRAAATINALAENINYLKLIEKANR